MKKRNALKKAAARPAKNRAKKPASSPRSRAWKMPNSKCPAGEPLIEGLAGRAGDGDRRRPVKRQLLRRRKHTGLGLQTERRTDPAFRRRRPEPEAAASRSTPKRAPSTFPTRPPTGSTCSRWKPAGKPKVSGLSAAKTKPNSSELTATIDPSGSATTYSFEFATASPVSCSSDPSCEAPVPPGTIAASFSDQIASVGRDRPRTGHDLLLHGRRDERRRRRRRRRRTQLHHAARRSRLLARGRARLGARHPAGKKRRRLSNRCPKKAA